MTSSLINTMTIDSLKLPFSFDGEFVLLTLSDVLKVLKFDNSFKTKFYTMFIVESGSGKLMIDNEIHELKKGRVFL